MVEVCSIGSCEIAYFNNSSILYNDMEMVDDYVGRYKKMKAQSFSFLFEMITAEKCSIDL